jgi:small-conductance mechanosensitive channel
MTRQEVIDGLIALGQVVAVLAVAGMLGLLAQRLLWSILRRLARRTPSVADNLLLERCQAPAATLAVIAAARIALPLAPLEASGHAIIGQLLGLAMIGAVAWTLIRAIDAGVKYMADRYEIGTEDNLQARKIHTQLGVLKRVAMVIIIVVAVSAMLMTFERVRQLGASLLASAGIVGIVVGVAAQRTLANVIAGIQIALTQPIRLDDVVIVEGEWGRIEEITLTYVVVRIWDLRRLVVPITYFIETPFQNWTRTSAHLLGTVFIYVDYTVDVEEVRRKVRPLLESSGLWDGEVWNVQVTNASDRTMEVRAMMSASDSPAAWNLRCHMREQLLAWLRETYPQSLPRVRLEPLSGFESSPRAVE